MGKSEKRLCSICQKTVTAANISRHRRCMHIYCPDCKILVSKKRHPCFKKKGGPPGELAQLASKPDDQFLLIHVPVLIKQSLYKKLESDIALWPLYKNEEEEELYKKVRDNLKKNCPSCDLCQYFDLPEGSEFHSCKEPSREDIVSALKEANENKEPTEESIEKAYNKIFGNGTDSA